MLKNEEKALRPTGLDSAGAVEQRRLGASVQRLNSGYLDIRVVLVARAEEDRGGRAGAFDSWNYSGTHAWSRNKPGKRFQNTVSCILFPLSSVTS